MRLARPATHVDRDEQERLTAAWYAADCPPTPKLTSRELSRCVTLLGKGWTLQASIDEIQTQRPTLPLDPPEAA